MTNKLYDGVLAPLHTLRSTILRGVTISIYQRQLCVISQRSELLGNAIQINLNLFQESLNIALIHPHSKER